MTAAGAVAEAAGATRVAPMLNTGCGCDAVASAGVPISAAAVVDAAERELVPGVGGCTRLGFCADKEACADADAFDAATRDVALDELFAPAEGTELECWWLEEDARAGAGELPIFSTSRRSAAGFWE